MARATQEQIDAVPHGVYLVLTEGGSEIEMDLGKAHDSVRTRVATGEIQIIHEVTPERAEQVQDQDSVEQTLRDRIYDLEQLATEQQAEIERLTARLVERGEVPPTIDDPFAAVPGSGTGRVRKTSKG